MRLRSLALAAAVMVAGASFGQGKPLDHSVYDGWRSIRTWSMSDDGKWIGFQETPQEGDADLFLKTIDGNTEIKIELGGSQRFTSDGKFAVLTVSPKKEEMDKAKKDKVKPADQPKKSLVVVDLASGEQTVKERVASWSLSPEGPWVLYRLEGPTTEEAKKIAEEKKAAEAEAKKEEPKKEEGEQEEEKEKPKKRSSHRPGSTYTLWNLATGAEEEIEFISASGFSQKGGKLYYVVSDKEGKADGIYLRDLASGTVTKVINQKGVYSNVGLTEDASQIAFLTDKDDYDAEKPALSLYVWSGGKLKLRAKAGDEGLNEGWSISKSNVSFSKSGKRVFFSTKAPALPEKLDLPDDEKVEVDIWNWKDPLLMPQQLLMRSRLENMSYMAYVSTETGQIIQAGDEAISSWSFDRDRDSDYALGRDSTPYLQIRSWGDVPSDIYLLDATSGRRTLLLKTHFGSASLTPGGKYVIAADGKTQKVYSINVKTMKKVELTENTHDHFFNELHDSPSLAGFLGVAGSTENDERIFLNSSFDVWSIDPTGEAKPKCVTSRAGRRRNIQFRLNRLGSTETHIDVSKPVLLSSSSRVDYTTRYAWGNFEHGAIPVTALEADGNVSSLRKAKNSDAVTYTIQRFDVAPDIHASTLEFGEPTKLSNLQRQLEPYRWGKAELVHWTGNDGQKLDGVLIVPDNLDLSKKHPMITYFYEKSASGFHRFRSPAPSASVINFPLFVSQGYVIFIPDINYKIGYPGESAMSAIMPGIHKVVDLGFVDEKRIGLEGQSWGGYQIAYMVTETDMFKCAWAGAPVSNMFSAYGGIRTGSGLVRAMQYEVGQSRIGDTIWGNHLRYLENSPLFFVDKINTPLAIMSNDNDGAVPHAQGIELFAALRRLQKPSWMVVYNNEGHNLMQRKNRKDLSIRLSQFFDHFLKGAPAPVWMSDGVPAVMKGRTMGTELKGEKKEKKG